MTTRRIYVPAAALAAALIIPAVPHPALSQDAGLVVVDAAMVAKGFRASKLRGTAVTNDRNEKIGSLDDIIIGRDRVLFATIEVGGFLHIGSRLVAVPYQSLQIENDGQKIVLPGATEEALKKLPEFKYTS